MNKLWPILASLVLTGFPTFGGTFSTTSTFIRVPDQAIGTASGDTIPSSTNTIELDANVYIPDGAAAPAPAIVIMHGYGGSKNDGPVVTLAQDFASAGYVVVTPSARGFGQSDGFVTLAGPNETNDLKTIILAMQTGQIGDSPAVAIPINPTSKFGVTGASYGGGHSFEIMRTHVAGLRAVAPIIGWTDLYQALSPNDVPKLSYAVGFFASGFNFTRPNYDNFMFDRFRHLLGGVPEQNRQGDAQANVDWRSVIFNPSELTVPAFVIQGWKDWLFPAEQATSLLQANSGIPFFKLYIGGLGHAPATTDINNPEAVYLRTQLLSWFDHWLKGIDTGITTEPPVTVAPARTAIWSQAALIHSNTFPLPGTTTATYYFNGLHLSTAGAAGKPLFIPPTTASTAIIDPIRAALGSSADALIAAAVLVNNLLNSGAGILDSGILTQFDDSAAGKTFSTLPLASDTKVVGLPALHLFVSAKGAGAYYFVEILETLPDGSNRLVTRGAFKDHANRFKAAHEIDFSPFSINHTFKAGNEISVRVASRDFPFFLPNLSEPTIQIYRDSAHPSNVTLPIVP